MTVDSGPVVWPMLDDRPRPASPAWSCSPVTGSGCSNGGTATRDLEESTFDLELGDWHRYRARPAQGTVGGGGVSNASAYDDRVEVWRARFVRRPPRRSPKVPASSASTASSPPPKAKLGQSFNEPLPADMRNRLATTVHLNLIDLPAAEAGAA